MYDSEDETPGLCPVCHNVLKKIPNLDYRMEKKKGDVFCTYDMFCIVTEKFKNFCEDNGYEGLKFIALPKSPGYYYFESEKIFKIDVVKRLAGSVNPLWSVATFHTFVQFAMMTAMEL